MTPSATQVNLVNAVSTPAAAQQQATPASDSPFSQVLSSEIGQHQRTAEAKEAKEADRVKSDSKDTPATNPVGEANAGPAHKSGVASDTDDAKDAPKTESAASDASIPAVLPDTLMALAMQLDLLKSLPADKSVALSTTSAATGANPVLLDASQTPLRILPGSQATDAAAGVAKSGAGSATLQPGTNTAPPNLAPTLTPTFAGQLAAARLSDALKTDEPSPAMLIPSSFAAITERINFSAPPLPHVAANMLAPSVGTTAWGQALGDKLIWMTTGALQTASLTLNPPDLGPLQIVLNLTHDQATASFFATQPEVRQALEAALPKLRDMMHQAGIQLGQTTVSSDTPPQQDTAGRQARGFTPPFAAHGDVAGLPAASLPVMRSGRGLVDTFA